MRSPAFRTVHLGGEEERLVRFDDAEAELELTTENTDGVEQRVLPTFAVLLEVLPLLLLSPTDEPLPAEQALRFVHGEESLTLHRPLPPSDRVTVTGAIRAIYDRG